MTSPISEPTTTLDQPHNTGWTEGNWASVQLGQKVMLTSSIGSVESTVRTKCLASNEGDYLVLNGHGAPFNARDWSLFVEATPKPALPTEPGDYRMRNGGGYYHLDVYGIWRDNGFGHIPNFAPAWPLDKLEPVAETVENFIARLVEKVPAEGNTYRVHAADLLEVAAEFGVTP